MSDVLVTVCARAGSVGVPGKAVHDFLGRPLIEHTIRAGLDWPRGTHVVVSTDSEDIAAVARDAGADVPFLRPDELAGAEVGKLPVITHALRESERAFDRTFETVVDLDLTCPLRTVEDIERGWALHADTACDVCFSVVPARKNPYFNMVERGDRGVQLVKQPAQTLAGRAQAPAVWEMNASIYVYSAGFLRGDPLSVWDGRCELFEMPAWTRFDIDEPEDIVVSEALARWKGFA